MARGLSSPEPISSYSGPSSCRRNHQQTWCSSRGPLEPWTCFSLKPYERSGGVAGIPQGEYLAYHPQTDGLVERFNRTLTSMLAKMIEKGGKDWNQRLPYVLITYRVSQQHSTLESPFFLLYGRNPRLPTDSLLYLSQTRKFVGLQECGQELATRMSEAWELAQKGVGCAQQRQKQCCVCP